MKPFFTTLQRHYPDKETREDLLERIGWGDVIKDPNFENTCAIRMSVGLAGAGVSLPGARMVANAGALRGKRIEPGQAKLSNILKAVWGAPEIFKTSRAAGDGIDKRSGVISFFRIYGASGPNEGHIDLIHPVNNSFHRCARSCHFGALEFWFWPLK